MNPTGDEAEANSRAARIKVSVESLLGPEFSGTIQKRPGHVTHESLMNATVRDDVPDPLVP